MKNEIACPQASIGEWKTGIYQQQQLHTAFIKKGIRKEFAVFILLLLFMQIIVY